ncbi:THAP domain-containing protein 11-like [Limulus polyphemus]|uniref:THAP domain-containing protein 11-like n=1 Tax=Limulus polyphemus TaxID=6850 RepID=A0ABM1SEQ0_LIMPO|nr:THAP domain-containing protein 11-like [Limulus polyphemus]
MSSLHCCVPHCTNDSRYDKKGRLSFHRFPKDKTLRKQWICNIGRDVGEYFQHQKRKRQDESYSEITDNTRVCSAHFKEDDIIKTLTGLRKLKANTVPSLFKWFKCTPSRPPLKRRYLQ